LIAKVNAETPPRGFKDSMKESVIDRVKDALNRGETPARRDLLLLKHRLDRAREKSVGLSPYMVSLLRLEGKI
jgi:hypothetical protein